MYSRDMKPTSKTSIETQVPGRDFWNTENTRGTEKRQRLYDGQQLKRTEKQFRSTIVIQNIIGKMQLGRQTFCIKNY